MDDEAVKPTGNIAVESCSTQQRSWLSSVRRPRTSPGPRAFAFKRTLQSEDDDRRDSALASSTGTTSNEPPSPTSLRKTPSLPAIVVQDTRIPDSQRHASQRHSPESDCAPHADDTAFGGLDTIIPTGSFDDLTSDTQISFSKRGSMLLGGKKANRRSRQMDLLAEGTLAPSTPPHLKEQAQPGTASLSPPTPTTQHLSPRSTSRYSARARSTSQRVLSTDEMTLSRKVRCMYKHGNEGAVNWDTPEEEASSVQNSYLGHSGAANTPVNGSSLTVDGNDTSSLVSSRRGSAISKEPTEVAGGLEDWANLEGGEVDRYGFIIPKKSRSKGGANGVGLESPDEPRIHRVTTTLQLLSEEPRRRRIGRSASRAQSASPNRRASQKSAKPARSSVFSGQTAGTRSTQKPMRHATNKLPYNRDRRLKDEASDMLKLPPGLAEVAEQEEGGRAAQAMKAKEIERNDKWRRMARVVKAGADKGGMLFDFDTRDPKLISRTWKGIPDRWRATAWYSFLAASAKADPDSPTEEELIESYYELQEESSVEDVQIDVDVPRTINRHIMFRRRYRGGQRLLFRVLHAMSLYLPDTGYVQGMAALAATLLCYYEEDRAFVMLVRLWMLRGLERLYEAGFEGLMEALDDFEQNWLRGGDVAKKLNDECVSSTAYGTRWYLTLFNYSLPFPAQLRVWDVFMLLGDKSYSSSPTSKFNGDLDVLHATSAALIDATREILLDSDFENAMKVLTSWIPIKDEELLMRVAKAEYRMRKKRANA
ncbi:RabGAP/TBC [Clathrospora elynae]|uniref:RabGAP/TBC n=1 Tax=Clathrospora elynae TaxID=706981 RepID=A0A6A5SE94_9PLEO|nr:RabGAP/TBC [Clathrospora elynae]